MLTKRQLILKPRQKKYHRNKALVLDSCPQKKGVCLKVFVTTPKKPNSALRKVARLLLSNKKKITAYIPGIGHNLKKYSSVLIYSSNIKDLPSIRYKIIRGKYDSLCVQNRFSSRSKYGVKKSSKN